MGQRTDDLKMKATKKWNFFRYCTKAAAALLRQKAAKLKLFCLLYVHSALFLEITYRMRIRPMFGTIPSIPIPTPLANFGIELTLHSNSTLGIGVATPIPTQRNWGDSTGIPISKFPTLCSPLKRRKS